MERQSGEWCSSVGADTNHEGLNKPIPAHPSPPAAPSSFFSSSLSELLLLLLEEEEELETAFFLPFFPP